MLGDLYFAVRKISVGIIMILIGGNGLSAQQGFPQNCNNTDPGSNPGDIGCISFIYQAQPVTYTTVRAKDGKIWLQQNLGSSRVAESVNDENAYGDLFQWGRWDDGHQLRNSSTLSSPSNNTPVGLAGISSFITGSPAWWSTNGLNDKWAGNIADIQEMVGADPCKVIGEEWKMPSQAEWVEIVPLENITLPAKAYDSNLKLPMGGNRASTNGEFSFVGQRGYFWSSDPTGIGGKYLYIGTTMSNPSAGASRGQGASVRCIKPTFSLSTSEVRLNNHTVVIYPNPTKGTLTVKADAAIENVNVINAVGQKMNAQFSNNQVNMNGIPQGVYIVELKLKNGQSVSKKMIKE